VYRSKGCVVREDRKKGGNKGWKQKHRLTRPLTSAYVYH